ncbi:TIGR03668 family PPOX class F420-dependent oxidoreductase [Streptomyces sp. NPDC046805]|uniref:TIGR03668 family PPOX class F420-dependent oxidoreductase n=1 Tax=Streptomyces sp. NPDC046805 TaxID=3155134 RepID=UPI0033FA42F5
MPAMSADEARRRFAGARVARLATVDESGRPHLVPVVFAQSATGGTDRIVTAVDHKPKTTVRLKRLRNIAAHPSVCLLVDAYDDEDWDRLWWVRADGEAHVLPPDAADLSERAAYATAVAHLRDKYPPYRNRPPTGPLIVIAVRRWTGWRASARDGAR